MKVKKIQEKIGVKVDGIFGILTEKAVKEFQRKNDLVVDGIVGVKTFGNFSIQQIYKLFNHL